MDIDKLLFSCQKIIRVSLLRNSKMNIECTRILLRVYTEM